MTNNREDMSSTGKVTSQAKAPLNKKRKEDALDATLSDSSIEELEGPTPSRPRTKRKARRSTKKKTPTSETESRTEHSEQTIESKPDSPVENSSAIRTKPDDLKPDSSVDNSSTIHKAENAKKIRKTKKKAPILDSSPDWVPKGIMAQSFDAPEFVSEQEMISNELYWQKMAKDSSKTRLYFLKSVLLVDNYEFCNLCFTGGNPTYDGWSSRVGVENLI
jgi:hypothetical protein